MPDPTPRHEIPEASEVIETTDRTARVSSDGVDLVRTWSVRMPSVNNGARGALIQTEIPRRGQRHPEETYTFCDSVEAVPDSEDEYIFLVTARYKSSAASPNEPEENPLFRSMKYVLTDTTTQEEVAEDLDGVKVVNSSSEPLFNAIRTVANHVLTITRNEPFFPWGYVTSYRSTVNSDAFFGFAPNTWVCRSITGASQYDGGIYFAEVSYRFEHDPLGWNRKIMDLGTRKINTEWQQGQKPEDRWIPLEGQNGRQFQGNTLLDGNGQPLADTLPAVFLPVEGPPWKFYKEMVFGALHLE